MQKHGRHAPAFVLIQLAKAPGYGLDILKRLKAEMPVCNLDSAIIYRSLQKLEEAGAVIAEWDTSESGPAKKCYEITEIGLAMLIDYKEDAALSIQKLQYLLEEIDQLEKSEGKHS